MSSQIFSYQRSLNDNFPVNLTYDSSTAVESVSRFGLLKPSRLSHVTTDVACSEGRVTLMSRVSDVILNLI